MKSPSERQKGELLLLHLVWLNFCLPYSGLYLQDFLAFLLSQAKEVFYASPRICSSVQNKEEPPAHFEKHFCLFLALQKVTMVLKTFLNDIVENVFGVVVLEFDDSCYADAKQYHLALFSTCNSALNTSLRSPIRMWDFIQLCDSIWNFW